MDVAEVTDGWYCSRRHGEGGGNGEYLATGRRAVLINDDGRSFDVGLVRPETAC